MHRKVAGDGYGSHGYMGRYIALLCYTSSSRYKAHVTFTAQLPAYVMTAWQLINTVLGGRVMNPFIRQPTQNSLCIAHMSSYAFCIVSEHFLLHVTVCQQHKNERARLRLKIQQLI
jgi:hypothetical protein